MHWKLFRILLTSAVICKQGFLHFCENTSSNPDKKIVDSFIKTSFYWKIGCTKICNHAETFNANKGYKFATAVFMSSHCLQNINLWYTFETLLAQKRGLGHSYFYMKINHFNTVFYMTWDMSSVFSDGYIFLRGTFFLRSRV